MTTLAENYAVERNAYYNGSWYDVPFVASLAVFIAVALKGRPLISASQASANRSSGVWMSRLAIFAVLSLPAVIVAVVLDNRLPLEISRFRIVLTAVTLLCLASLVFVKQRRLHEELSRSNRSLELASTTDPLTMIRNRRFFSETIEGDIAQTIRLYRSGNDVATRDLIFYLIDMDDFKEVNDQYGHGAGDLVLMETARRIQSAIRDSDFVVRWGGEEFLVVSRYTDRRRADMLALRIIREVRETTYAVSSSQQIQRTCSIGWAAFPWLENDVDAMGFEEVLNMADRALSQAKRAGKNQVISMNPRSTQEGLAANIQRSSFRPWNTDLTN